jgi:hypothetical protein
MNGRRIRLEHSTCVDVTFIEHSTCVNVTFIFFDPDRQAAGTIKAHESLHYTTTVPPAACVYQDR